MVVGEVILFVTWQLEEMCHECCADLRISNVMELNTKDKTHADSTMEASLSQNDLAGREAALSFSGEEMTKAAKKRYHSCWLLRALLPSIVSHLTVAWPPGGRVLLKSHAKQGSLPQGVPAFHVSTRVWRRCAGQSASCDCLASCAG